MKYYSALLKNDRGFAVLFAITLLAICTLIGISAINTSIDETAISANDVSSKQVFFMGEAGAVIASSVVLSGEGTQLWPTKDTPVTLLDSGGAMVTVDKVLVGDSSGTVQIVDGRFLQEAPESYKDADNHYQWKNMTAFYASGGSDSALRPKDDPFVSGAVDALALNANIPHLPDIRISLNNLYMEVDVDKIQAKMLAGGGAEFASRTDSSGSQGMKVMYVMDCMATLPGLFAGNNAPKSEIILGYRYIFM